MTDERTRRRPDGLLPARVAGWTAVVFGAVHTVIAPFDRKREWAEIVDAGPWTALTLDVTPERTAHSETFWVGPGSFGVPVLLVGALVLWAAGRGERVPRPIGWAVTAWGGVLVALLPRSPAWALLLVGALLSRRGRGTDGEGQD